MHPDVFGALSDILARATIKLGAGVALMRCCIHASTCATPATLVGGPVGSAGCREEHSKIHHPQPGPEVCLLPFMKCDSCTSCDSLNESKFNDSTAEQCQSRQHLKCKITVQDMLRHTCSERHSGQFWWRKGNTHSLA